MIRLENIMKTYTAGGAVTKALQGISLNIDDGDYLAIMGTSGCGKSTLLNILGGMDRPSGGSYFFDDIAVHEMSVKKLHVFRKQNISFVFQNFALLNRYTVFENIELPLIARGVGMTKRKKIVNDTMERLGISDLKNKLPIHISGGQQQRTALARAIVTENRLILADEPTGALDKNTSEEIMGVFDEINKSGRTLVIVTHDVNVAQHAKKTIHMEDGLFVESDLNGPASNSIES